MRPTRRTQPYRKGPRPPGPALDAQKRGRGALQNPQDIWRRTVKGGLSALMRR